MDNDAIGRDLLSKAEKKLKSLSLFGNKYDEAAELLAQAANNFKIAKACEFETHLGNWRKFSSPRPI